VGWILAQQDFEGRPAGLRFIVHKFERPAMPFYDTSTDSQPARFPFRDTLHGYAGV